MLNFSGSRPQSVSFERRFEGRRYLFRGHDEAVRNSEKSAFFSSFKAKTSRRGRQRERLQKRTPTTRGTSSKGGKAKLIRIHFINWVFEKIIKLKVLISGLFVVE